MKVKELINKLLDTNMNAEVYLFLNKPHDDQYGRNNGYIFHIDDIDVHRHEVGLTFTDWRDEDV